jgi:hypothetical protein
MKRMEYYESVQSFSAAPMERKLKSCKLNFCHDFKVLVLAQVRGSHAVLAMFRSCLSPSSKASDTAY